MKRKKSIPILVGLLLPLLLTVLLLAGGCTSQNSGSADIIALVVEPQNAVLASGGTLQYTVLAVNSDNSTSDITSEVTLASSNTGVATIDQYAVATGIQSGTTTISTTFLGISGSTTLTVTGGPLTISPADPSIPAGTTQQFTATGVDPTTLKTVKVTKALQWTSSDTSVATIDATGLATGVAVGVTTITATDDTTGQTGTTTLTVTNAVLASIVVTPNAPYIPLYADEPTNTVFTNQQFTAMGTYTDGTIVDVTNSVTWNSTNTATATIDAAGLATAVAEGTTVINAVDPTTNIMSNDAILTVEATALQWEVPLAGAPVIEYSSPAVDSNGNLFFGADDGFVYGITPDGVALTGWPFDTGAPIWGSPAIGVDGTIYVGNIAGELYALNPDGTMHWPAASLLGDAITSTPAIGLDGTIYVGVTIFPDGALYSIDPVTAIPNWTFDTGTLGAIGPITGSTVIDTGGVLYFGSWDGDVYALNDDGTQVASWVTLWGAADNGGFPTGAPVEFTPSIDGNGTIISGSDSGFVFGINPDGSEYWSFATTGNAPVLYSPIVDLNGIIWVGSVNGEMYALDPDLGTQVFMFDTGTSLERSGALAADGTLYFGDFAGIIYALNTSDASVKFAYPTAAAAPIICAPVIVSDGTVYFGAVDGTFTAIWGSAPLASTAWPMAHHDAQHTGRMPAPTTP